MLRNIHFMGNTSPLPNTLRRQVARPPNPSLNRLPIELRTKIWNYAAYISQVIEIQNHDSVVARERDFEELIHHHDTSIWAAPSARQPPPIMHVCQENRAEAMKVYILVKFDSFSGPRPEHYLGREGPREPKWIYYNPEADIIYFGTHSCVEAIINVCRLGICIPRVAINRALLKYSGFQTCRTFFQHKDLRVNEGSVDDGYEIVLAALHGTNITSVIDSNPSLYPGIKGLREVFWEIHRPSLDLEQLQMSPFDYQFTQDIQPGPERRHWQRDWDDEIWNRWCENYHDDEPWWSGRGRYSWKYQRKQTLEYFLKELISEHKKPDLQQCRWTGENKPAFFFTNLGYRIPDEMRYKHMFVNLCWVEQYEEFKWFCERYSRSDCDLTIYPKGWVYKGHYVFKIFGKQNAVDKVLEQVGNFKLWLKGKFEVSVEPLGAEDEVLVVDEKFYFESLPDDGDSRYIAPCICQDYPPAGTTRVRCDEEWGREKGCYITSYYESLALAKQGHTRPRPRYRSAYSRSPSPSTERGRSISTSTSPDRRQFSDRPADVDDSIREQSDFEQDEGPGSRRSWTPEYNDDHSSRGDPNSQDNDKVGNYERTPQYEHHPPSQGDTDSQYYEEVGNHERISEYEDADSRLEEPNSQPYEETSNRERSAEYDDRHSSLWDSYSQSKDEGVPCTSHDDTHCSRQEEQDSQYNDDEVCSTGWPSRHDDYRYRSRQEEQDSQSEAETDDRDYNYNHNRRYNFNLPGSFEHMPRLGGLQISPNGYYYKDRDYVIEDEVILDYDEGTDEVDGGEQFGGDGFGSVDMDSEMEPSSPPLHLYEDPEYDTYHTANLDDDVDVDVDSTPSTGYPRIGNGERRSYSGHQINTSDHEEENKDFRDKPLTMMDTLVEEESFVGNRDEDEDSDQYSQSPNNQDWVSQGEVDEVHVDRFANLRYQHELAMKRFESPREVGERGESGKKMFMKWKRVERKLSFER